MTFESLYNWNEITCEWATKLDKQFISRRGQGKDLYFLKVIRLLILLHALVLCEIFDQAKICIDELLTVMAELETADLEEKSISTKVLSHVVHATIQKSLEKMNLHEKEKEVGKKVTPLIMTTNIETSTLYGIRSFCFYRYYQGIQIASDCAKKALNLNPDCSYWNLAYAMCLRQIRRWSACAGNLRKPSFLEKKYFEIAYAQNNHPHFGIRLAICYKESREREKALQMFEEIKQMPIEDSCLWLKLGRQFMFLKKYEQLKECLDEAEKMHDSSSTMHRFKGLYYMQGYKNYDEAMIHLEKASDLGDYRAFSDYLYCLYCKNPRDRRVLELLEDSFEKYVKEHKFAVEMNIALYYAKNLNDYETALVKLRDIVKENPREKYLKNFFYIFNHKSHHINVYWYIRNELLPKSRSVLEPNNREAWEAYDFLEVFVNLNQPRQNDFRYNPRTD